MHTAEFIGALLTAGAFLWLGSHQLYLAANVERLEASGKLTPEKAARIGRKPMRLIGFGLIITGLFLIASQFVQIS